MRGVLCLFFAISFFASLLGCGQEGDEQETVPPEVTYVNWGSSLDLREGDIVPGNATFTVGFSKVTESVEINVSGAERTTLSSARSVPGDAGVSTASWFADRRRLNKGMAQLETCTVAVTPSLYRIPGR